MHLSGKLDSVDKCFCMLTAKHNFSNKAAGKANEYEG